MNGFKSVKELVQIATENLPEGGGYPTYPIVTRIESQLQAVVGIYNQSLPNKKPMISPPHQIIYMDPRNGAIVKDEFCSPNSFGFNKNETEEEYIPSPISWDDLDRFNELSPVIWEAFDLSASSYNEYTINAAKDYAALLQKIVAKPLLPFYRAIAPDFFQWLEQVTK